MSALSKRVVDAAKPKEGDYFVWCSSTPGFGVRIYPSGRKAFVAQVRVGRLQRRVKIGVYGPFTVEQARKKAEDIIRGAAEGRDPQEEKREARAALTVAELCDLYLEAARAGLVTTRFKRAKKMSTVAIDEGRVARHIKPLIGSGRARDLTRAAVQRMADDIAKGKTAGVFPGKPRGRAVVTGGPKTAARVVELLGGIYSWAEKRGEISGVNPTKGVETVGSEARDRVLSSKEIRKLGTVLAECAHQPAAQALHLIALTGLRREEACALRWHEIDLEGHCVRLEQTKTGRSMRPIGRAAVDLLRQLSNRQVWVFPNRKGSGSADMKKAIAALFEKAGIHDARSHDLRRTFGTTAANLGYSDATIGEILGHSRRGVTSVHYIRRPDSALIAAAESIASEIGSLLFIEEHPR
jgi:integrase